MNEVLLWAVFGSVITVMLALDLGVFHRKAHTIRIKEAVIWSTVWIAVALLFYLGVHFMLGSGKAMEFITAYVVEKSLSVDNLFVFLLIFRYFCVPQSCHHRVLFWGILGALITRGIFIAAGLAILEAIHWVIYLFGAFLVFTGVRMSMRSGMEVQPERNPALRLFRKFVPVSCEYKGDKFTVIENGCRMATPLIPVLLVVETSDIIFAVDSIPAVLAVSLDPLIVYSSNVFAILGLRALYFLIAGAIQRARYLNYGLSAILIFMGFKMLSSGFYELPVAIALGGVGGILLIAIVASILNPKPKEEILPGK